MSEWEKALALNPNSVGPYQGMGWLYYSNGDFVNSIESFLMASRLERGPELSSILKDLGFALTSIGFYAKSKEQYQEALYLEGDTSDYFAQMSYAEYYAGHYTDAIERGQRAISGGSQLVSVLNNIGSSYLALGQYEESLHYFREYARRLDSIGQTNYYSLPWLAYAFKQNGLKEESEFYINQQITLSRGWIKRGISGWEENYMRLALVYAIRGEKEQAVENLRLYKKLGPPSAHMVLLRNSPLFETINDDPCFNQIMDDLETKFQEEHEQVRQWLEENDMP